jgi:hypothetical protein
VGKRVETGFAVGEGVRTVPSSKNMSRFLAAGEAIFLLFDPQPTGGDINAE